jgi:hypothetical protein
MLCVQDKAPDRPAFEMEPPVARAVVICNVLPLCN